jgi:hypothetical protein
LRRASPRVDALSAVAGPYALRIIEDEIGAPAGTVVNAVLLEAFGGLINSPAAPPDFAAACDGDADRNMILGRGTVLSPSDVPGGRPRRRGARRQGVRRPDRLEVLRQPARRRPHLDLR